MLRLRLVGKAMLVVCGMALLLEAETAKDPGVRPGTIGAGKFFGNLPTSQISMLPDFTAAFNRVAAVPSTPGTPGGGLGPVFNSNSCANCHAQPAAGGSSPASNPLYSVYQLLGALNTMPAFISPTSAVLVPDSPICPI